MVKEWPSYRPYWNDREERKSVGADLEKKKRVSKQYKEEKRRKKEQKRKRENEKRIGEERL